jgi:hypothetical protein
MSGFTQMGALLGDIMAATLEEHPNQAARFAPYMQQATASDTGNTFDAFVPPQNMLSSSFTVVVPILTPESIPFVAIQRCGVIDDVEHFTVACIPRHS